MTEAVLASVWQPAQQVPSCSASTGVPDAAVASPVVEGPTGRRFERVDEVRFFLPVI